MSLSWWDKLSTKEQEQYLKEHPGSKRKITKKQDSEFELNVSKFEKDLKPAPKNVTKRIISYVKENPGKVAIAAASTMLGMQTTYEKNVDGMPEAKRNNFASAIRTAIHLKDSKALKQIATKVGLQTGALFIGAVGFSLLTGVNISFAIPLLAQNFWEDIKDVPDNVEYLKNVGNSYIDTVKSSLEDIESLKNSIVMNEADEKFDLDIEDSNPKNIEKSFELKSSHESDINKILVKIGNVNIANKTTYLCDKKDVNSILNHMHFIESTISSLNSIMIASIINKNLLARSTKFIIEYKNEYRRCYNTLTQLCSENTYRKLPIHHKLKNYAKYDSYEVTPFSTIIDNSNKTVCEMHKFSNLKLKNLTFPYVRVYTYKNNGKLYIACIINSEFLPKTFDVIKIKDIDKWLSSKLMV